MSLFKNLTNPVKPDGDDEADKPKEAKTAKRAKKPVEENALKTRLARRQKKDDKAETDEKPKKVNKKPASEPESDGKALVVKDETVPATTEPQKKESLKERLARLQSNAAELQSSAIQTCATIDYSMVLTVANFAAMKFPQIKDFIPVLTVLSAAAMVYQKSADEGKPREALEAEYLDYLKINLVPLCLPAVVGLIKPVAGFLPGGQILVTILNMAVRQPDQPAQA